MEAIEFLHQARHRRPRDEARRNRPRRVSWRPRSIASEQVCRQGQEDMLENPGQESGQANFWWKRWERSLRLEDNTWLSPACLSFCNDHTFRAPQQAALRLYTSHLCRASGGHGAIPFLAPVAEGSGCGRELSGARMAGVIGGGAFVLQQNKRNLKIWGDKYHGKKWNKLPGVLSFQRCLLVTDGPLFYNKVDNET